MLCEFRGDKKPFILINQGHFTTTMKASKRHYGLFFKNTDFFFY